MVREDLSSCGIFTVTSFNSICCTTELKYLQNFVFYLSNTSSVTWVRIDTVQNISGLVFVAHFNLA